MIKHNSFDVFDTIIGRICYKGTEIFDIMESYTGIHGFKRMRISSETEGIDNIYRTIQNILQINTDQLRDLELKLEYDFSFPIHKYLDAIKKDDILISDMYLSDNQIRTLINKHKQIANKLHVSMGGKSSGIIWKSPIKNTIAMHYGDNYVSDYHNAIQNGVHATHITNVDMTPIEKEIEHISKEAAYITRAVRLSTQTDTHIMNTVLHTLMLPIGILLCYWIKYHCDDFNATKIVFFSRDGYWLHVLFNALFPNNNTEYTYFSRKLSKHPPSIAAFTDKYANDRCIFIDMFGSGNTVNTAFNGKIPTYRYLLPFQYCSTHFKNMYTLFQNFSYPISMEDIFSAPHGSVADSNTLYDPEYDISVLQSYMDGVKLFCNYAKIYTTYITLNKNVTSTSLQNSIGRILKLSDISASSITSVLGPHMNEHTLSDPKYPLKYYSQIEQDKHYIEKVSRFRPFGKFIEIGAYDGITGSNTYYLEKNLGWSGILVECLPHLAEKCRTNRKAAVYENAIYNESGKIVGITVPTGDEIVGGKEQLSGINSHFRPASLAHFNKSYNTCNIVDCVTITINDILEKEGITVIDYMSLDIEGYELAALNTIDYDRFKIKFITVEHGTDRQEQAAIYKLLSSKGYKLHRNNLWDDEYILAE